MQIEFNPLSDCSSRYCTHSRKWNDSFTQLRHVALIRCSFRSKVNSINIV